MLRTERSCLIIELPFSDNFKQNENNLQLERRSLTDTPDRYEIYMAICCQYAAQMSSLQDINIYLKLSSQRFLQCARACCD